MRRLVRTGATCVLVVLVLPRRWFDDRRAARKLQEVAARQQLRSAADDYRLDAERAICETALLMLLEVEEYLELEALYVAPCAEGAE